MSDTPYPMSDTPYSWGDEHFCAPDAAELYHAEPDRLDDVGHPVKLPGNPRPPTFCSRCLKWFDNPQYLTIEGSEQRPPHQKET